eukprot:5824118-Pyramimonas_sp.AAC.1
MNWDNLNDPKVKKLVLAETKRLAKIDFDLDRLANKVGHTANEYINGYIESALLNVLPKLVEKDSKFKVGVLVHYPLEEEDEYNIAW